MASLTLTGGVGTVSWQINELQSAFNTANYLSAGITGDIFSDGASSITGIADSRNAPSSGSATYVSGSRSYPSGQYYFFGFARAANGLYYVAGGQWVTIQAAAIRPSNWYWNNIYQGCSPMTAYEWNAFTQRISDFERIKA